MQLSDPIGKAFERSNALQTYWTYFGTVSFAIVGFIAIKAPESDRVRLGAIATVGFVAFAAINLGALIDVTRQRLALQNALIAEQNALMEQSTTPVSTEAAGHQLYVDLASTIRPATATQVAAFHIAFDVLVVIGIWLLALRQGA